VANNKSFWPENWGLLYAAFAFSQGIGLLGYWALPVVTGALITSLGLSAQDAGLIGTIEFAGLLISSLVAANFVGQGRRKLIGLVAILIVLCANLASGLMALSFQELSIIRFIAGIGAGLALAVGNATIANAIDAEKFSGHLTIALVGFMVLIMPVLGRLSEAYGIQGVFLGLGAAVVIGGLSWFFLPDQPNKASSNQSSLQHTSNDSFNWFSKVSLAVLIIALFFGARDTLPWLAAEQLGTDTGMTTTEVGDVFSMMFAISIIGPTLLVFLTRYFSAWMILVTSMTITGLAAWTFTTSNGSALLFTSGIYVWSTIYFIAFAQLNAVAALADRSGRLVSAVGSLFIAGIMIAPVFGGYLLELGGYLYLGYAELLLTIIIAAIVLIGIRQKTPKETSEETS